MPTSLPPLSEGWYTSPLNHVIWKIDQAKGALINISGAQWILFIGQSNFQNCSVFRFFSLVSDPEDAKFFNLSMDALMEIFNLLVENTTDFEMIDRDGKTPL